MWQYHCYRALGLAIIAKAAEDWRNKSVEPRAKHDVAQFMRSKWFTNLCDLLEIDAPLTKKAITEQWGRKFKLKEELDE